MTTMDAVIVGAGQGGLGVSYFLQQNGHSHVVFERGRVGESWSSQRWDSFKLNTPNFMSALPGLPYDGPQADGFGRRDELVHYFQRYVEHFQLPVRTGVTVVSSPDIKFFFLYIYFDVASKKITSAPASSTRRSSPEPVPGCPATLPNFIRPTTATRGPCHLVQLSLLAVGNQVAR